METFMAKVTRTNPTAAAAGNHGLEAEALRRQRTRGRARVEGEGDGNE